MRTAGIDSHTSVRSDAIGSRIPELHPVRLSPVSAPETELLATDPGGPGARSGADTLRQHEARKRRVQVWLAAICDELRQMGPCKVRLLRRWDGIQETPLHRVDLEV